jgi:hypothetical protein
VKANRYECNLNVAGAVSLNGAENEEEPLAYAEQRTRKEKKMDRKENKSKKDRDKNKNNDKP